MAPKTGQKRALEDEVFESKSAKRQQKFTPRIKTVKAAKMEATESSIKRKKKRSTLTQLDFGRRSFLEIICDSGDEEGAECEVEITSTAKRKQATKRRKQPEKTKSQSTLTQPMIGKRSFPKLIGDSDDDGGWVDMEVQGQKELKVMTEQASTAKSNKGRKSKLPARTESQDTLTQFVKRSSNVDMMVISDSEDGALLSDVNVSSPGQGYLETTTVPAAKALYDITETAAEDEDVLEFQGNRKECENAAHEDAQQAIEGQARGPSHTPKTPKRVRSLPVPSSRSPPDTHLSTQITPRQQGPSQYRLPLKERSVNIQDTPVLRSVLKAPIRGSRLKSSQSCLVEPLQVAQLSPKPATRRSLRLSSVKTSQRNTAFNQIAADSESPTKRRVREFNARFAALEQEQAGLRPRRLRTSDFGNVQANEARLNLRQGGSGETQYTVGLETQAAFMQLPLEPQSNSSNHQRERSPSIVSCTQPIVNDSKDEAEVIAIDDNNMADRSNPVATIITGVAEDCAIEKAVLIPSSQTKNDIPEDTTPTTADAEESLPESPMLEARTTSNAVKDTQELASDQLLRETQQAWHHRVPSSPLALQVPRSSQTPSTQGRAIIRPSQATTVDQSITYSSVRSQLLLQLPGEGTAQTRPFSSSSVEEPIIDDEIDHVDCSSPLGVGPGLTVLSSSSPNVHEPKTPRVLRNLKEPLKLDQLVSDSLDMSIPAPPTWKYGDGFIAEDSDDGEL